MQQLDWKDKLESAYKNFEEYLKDPKWQEFNKTHQCRMLQLVFNDRTASRGEAEVNVPFEDVIIFLQDSSSIEKIDEMLERQQELASGDGYTIQYLKYKGVFPVSARDFIILTGDKRTGDNKHTFATVSVDYNKQGDKGAVRAKVKCAGYQVIKIDDKKTKVIYISDADPAGSIPGFIKTMVSKNQASVPVNLKRYLEKNKK